MAVPANVLKNVTRYVKADMAWMMNSNVAMYISNKKFNRFNEIEGNLGDTLDFDLAPRSMVSYGLTVPSFTPTVQRYASLKATQAANVNCAYSDQQFMFNMHDYMDRIGKSKSRELSDAIEKDILLNFTSGVVVLDTQNPAFGTNINPQSGPYRFFGDGVGSISSYGQLSQALANFRDFGAAQDSFQMVLPVTEVPAIVNSGLNQFAPKRNDEEAKTWEVTSFSGCDVYESNLLPIHFAGNVGNSADVLTFISINPAGDQITFSTSLGNDPNAVKAGDLFQFSDNIPGNPNLRFRTFIGRNVSGQPVQFRATQDAAAVAGSITMNITPALLAAPGLDQNLSSPLVSGQSQATSPPSHRAGIIMSGRPLYCGFPKLPNKDPYHAVSVTDPDSGMSLRHYWGNGLTDNTRGYIRDCVWASTLVADNCMRLIFPLK